MKKLLIMAIAGMLLSFGAAWAKDQAKPIENYKCTNRAGKVGVGTGRLSVENEYSSFLNKSARAGEYVIFKYDNKGKEYWFKSHNCSKI